MHEPADGDVEEKEDDGEEEESEQQPSEEEASVPDLRIPGELQVGSAARLAGLSASEYNGLMCEIVDSCTSRLKVAIWPEGFSETPKVINVVRSKLVAVAAFEHMASLKDTFTMPSGTTAHSPFPPLGLA